MGCGPSFMVDPSKLYGVRAIDVGPRKIVVCDSMDALKPLPRALPPPRNCVNCGAPHEPVCSYCGTMA